MLVGRDRERRLIDELVAAARLGRSGVLLVTGEAGIGKTALLRYARGAARGARILAAAGHEAERDVPFGGLSQLLQPTAEDLERIPAPQAQALGVALALREGRVVDRLAVGAAVLSLVSRYAEDGPVGVVVDDAHQLDTPSWEALTFAARRLLADPVFVVVAARSAELGPLANAGFPRLDLVGLEPPHAAELARRRAGRSTPQGLAALYRATGGNPLAVLELATDLPGLLASPPEGPVPVPTALAERYGRQVRALGSPARRLLLLVAVANGDPPVVARAAAALGLALGALADAERSGLVTVATNRIDFVHPLVRSAVYALAYPDERRTVHAATVDALPVHDADRRGWHRAAATLGTDDAVAAELAAVAGRAAARGAHTVAATAYDRAAALSSDDVARADRLLRCAQAWWRGGDGEAAVAAARRAVVLDPSPATRGRGLGLEGQVAAQCGSPAQGRALLVDAASCLAGDDPSQAVRLLAEAVMACLYQADMDAALSVADELDRLLARDLDEASAAVGTLAAGMARVLGGGAGIAQVRSGVALLQRAAERGEPPPVPSWLMLGPLFLRESGTARVLVQAALEQARRRSAVATMPLLLFLIARDGATTDRWTSAAAHYGEGIELARELGHTTELAFFLGGLAWLEARLGRAEQCRAHAGEALEICSRHPVTIARVWAQYALGESALASRDLAGALAVFTGLAGLLVDNDVRDPDLSPGPELAEALVHLGRVDEARAVAAAYRRAAAAKGQPWAMARAMRLRVLLDDGDVDGAYQAALGLHARTPDVFERARTQLVYGSRLRRLRRPGDARAPLRAAIATFQGLGSRPWADHAADELDATGETAARRGLSDADRLTARELQIALLLAEGRTTRETAAALFLSPKTVEYHLRHVYTKLDISARPELRARLGSRTGAGT